MTHASRKIALIGNIVRLAILALTTREVTFIRRVVRGAILTRTGVQITDTANPIRLPVGRTRVGPLGVSAVVCCAGTIGGDKLQDLKCGYLLGATPWKQQLMLAVGGVSSALIMAPVLSLLAQAYGIGVPTEAHPNPLLAPQANLMASVAKGSFGGELPWTMIGIGAAIGAAIIVLDEILKQRGSSFRTPVLACAVGIYLPIELSVPIFAGGLVGRLVERHFKPGDADGERERIHQKGTLFSAGLITGEALMGILIAVPIVAVGSADVLALPEAVHFGGWLGLVMLASVAMLLYRLAVREESTA